MKSKIIYLSDDESRLDQFLKIQIAELSRTKIQKMILDGKITVDSFIVKPSYNLKKNAIILINKAIEHTSANLLPEKIDLDIIHEDQDIIAINKPPGLIVHPGIKNRTGTLLNGLIYYCNKLSAVDNTRPGIIHRLDKETSGIIIIAKNNYSHYFISEQFANRKIIKLYKTFVWGRMDKNNFIEGYIRRKPTNRLAFELSKSIGKYSHSYYKINSSYDIPLSYLNVLPKTGRTHQIRVHLSSINHPIINDELYYPGSFKIHAYSQVHKSKIDKVLKSINRIALHAYSIEFIHPSNKKLIKLTAPIPDDFNKVIKILNDE